MRTLLAVGLATVLTAGFAVAVATPAVAAATCAQQNTVDKDGNGLDVDVDSPQDIDNDGTTDVVEGVPSAGAIDIRYGVGVYHGDYDSQLDDDPPRPPQRVSESYFTGLSATPGDAFGSSVAFADVDAGYCEDLAIGAPGSDGGRGAVVVALGSTSGLAAAGAVRIPGRSAGERFGSAVVARGNDLWIGAPDRTVAGQTQAGAIDHYRISGTTATLLETYTQGSHGIGGGPEKSDHFGALLSLSLDDTLAVGDPGEDIGTAVDAGMVTVVYTSKTTHLISKSVSIEQNSPGITGAAEAGDHFGAAASISDARGVAKPAYGDAAVAVGVPGEDVGAVRDVGMADLVNVPVASAPKEIRAFSLDSPGIPGIGAAGTLFGTSVAYDFDTLAVGYPGGSVRGIARAGVVAVLNGVASSGHLDYEGANSLDNLGDTPEVGDAVGAGLSMIAYTDYSAEETGSDGGAHLLIDAPGEDNGAGLVIATGERTCVSCGDTPRSMPIRDSAGARAGERYGAGASGTVGQQIITS